MCRLETFCQCPQCGWRFAPSPHTGNAREVLCIGTLSGHMPPCVNVKIEVAKCAQCTVHVGTFKEPDLTADELHTDLQERVHAAVTTHERWKSAVNDRLDEDDVEDYKDAYTANQGSITGLQITLRQRGRTRPPLHGEV
ncbi:MAG: hypothetical protein M1831_001933 [Alyxoria varia]|nr:MAG: hypothetical protein M1831_001933 [Alyxoria varia]